MKFKLGKTYLFGMFIICLIAIINFHVVSCAAVLWVDALLHIMGDRGNGSTGD